MATNMALATRDDTGLVKREFDRDEIDLIKQTVAIGATDQELKLFLYTCQRRGLDPLVKQIHFVKRKRKVRGNQWEEYGVIQTGIDGLRLVADRTGRYAPGRAPTFEERNGKPFSATAYIMKWVKGTWHEVSATVYYDEYVQTYWDNDDKRNVVTSMWESKPRMMLGKCAEAAALRRAFPEDLSGLYTDDEMGQADNPPLATIPSVRAPALQVVKGDVIDTRPAPEPLPAQERGVMANIPTNPQKFMEFVNGKVEVPYDNLPHLLNALQQEAGNPKWNWPVMKDADGWQNAYMMAVRHAESKVTPDSGEGETETEEAF